MRFGDVIMIREVLFEQMAEMEELARKVEAK